MIYSSTRSISHVTSHTPHLRGLIQSVFRFQGEIRHVEKISLTHITYANYAKIQEMAEDCIEKINSDLVTIDPSELKDTLFIFRLGLLYARYEINQTDTNLRRAEVLENTSPSWKGYFWWSSLSQHRRQFKHLRSHLKNLQHIAEQLNTDYETLLRAIHHAALAVIKKEGSEEDCQHILLIERLEETQLHLTEFLQEIQQQMEIMKKRKTVDYYEADRSHFYNNLMKTQFLVDVLPLQMKQAHLDTSFLTPNLLSEFAFDNLKNWKWHLLDHYVFRKLIEMDPPLRLVLQGLHRALQMESRQLLVYIDQVTGLYEFVRKVPPSQESFLKNTAPMPFMSAETFNEKTRKVALSKRSFPHDQRTTLAGPSAPDKKKSFRPLQFRPLQNREDILDLELSEIEEV